MATAFWTVAPGRGELRQSILPPPAPGEVLVRALVSAVSRGTESLVFQGRVPPELFDIMRCPFQEGDFPAPVKYGYCMVGMVEAGPDHVARPARLLPAPAPGPVRRSRRRCGPDPRCGPDRPRGLAANMETAVNILWDAPPSVGEPRRSSAPASSGCLTAALAGAHPGSAASS